MLTELSCEWAGNRRGIETSSGFEFTSRPFQAVIRVSIPDGQGIGPSVSPTSGISVMYQ